MNLPNDARGRHGNSGGRTRACKNKNGRVIDPAVQNSLRDFRVQLAQLAFFTGAGLPTFFSIARLRSSARGESRSALAFSR